MTQTIARVFTVPDGGELLGALIGVGLAFVTPGVIRRLGGEGYRAWAAPEVNEGVSAGADLALATMLMRFSPEVGRSAAIATAGTHALKAGILLARRVQGGGGLPLARQHGRSMIGKPGFVTGRRVLGPGDSVSRTGTPGGPIRMNFVVNDSNAEILNP